ncbi:unnamed protein product [Rotaria sp. Silwood1]|nr:unnamed protein product [Rotaria sp. Silwood1]
MKGADIGVGWVDETGSVHIQDRYAFANGRPMIDNTTIDWFALQGREASGWTAIQFKRLLDTCDIMDVPIKSGTNNLIFAYGLADPSPSGPNGEISYHENRRGSRTLPLRSYADPPSEETFAGLDYFEFRLNNYVVPPAETTYHCKIYKAPSNYSVKRHAIGHKTIVDSANLDLVHHLLMYECDPTAQFDDNNLPDGSCDTISQQLAPCASNIATGWAVGGDYMVAFPEEAGFPVGGNFPIKYYLVQMHYDNPNQLSNRTDSSGIRFYIGKELRQYDLGYLTLGADSSAIGLAIPPKVERFIVDSYCSADATMNFPEEGITIVSAFPHTHLQGRTVWTKLIRNKTAVQYLFDAEAYDFNYQYENRLPQSIKLFRGGERTKDEMCLHMMTYYPRMNNMYGCVTTNNRERTPFDYSKFVEWLLNLTWTPERAVQWQEFYDTTSRVLMYGASPNLQFNNMSRLPKYEDLKPVPCTKDQNVDQTTTMPVPTISSQSTTTNKAISYTSPIRQEILVFVSLISIVMTVTFI